MREIYGHGGGEPQYVPPVLFRDLRRHQGELQYQYICDELVRLKNDGALYATDLLAQSSHVRDMVGLALTGQTIDPESRTHVRAATPLPEEVATHRIHVRLVNGGVAPKNDDGSERKRPETIRYKRGVVPDPRYRNLGPKLGVGRDGESYSSHVVQKVDKWVDWESSEASMSLPEAWVCLSQHGRHCRPAKSLRLQGRYWLFEEADHPANKRPDDDKPRRGRPPKE